jgi:hypothetical protein
MLTNKVKNDFLLGVISLYRTNDQKRLNKLGSSAVTNYIYSIKITCYKGQFIIF